jgi:hypothetical protein
MTEKHFTLTPNGVERGSDGLHRFMIDVYDYPCMQDEFVAELNKATGLEWKHLGTFMDTACFATKGEIDRQFTIPYPDNTKD